MVHSDSIRFRTDRFAAKYGRGPNWGTGDKYDYRCKPSPLAFFIGGKQYGSLGYKGSERILNERYLLAFLLEYAATLGLIDVALIPPAGARLNYRDLWGADDLVYFSRYDGLMYFRINALGAYCLDIETEYQPALMEKKPVLSVLPNLEITAIGAELEVADRTVVADEA